jgi:hypothetical protein
MSLRPAMISLNAMSNLKPELIGLAAWLCCHDTHSYNRDKILKHAAAHHSLEGLRNNSVFDSPEDFELACQAYAEGARFMVAESPAVPPPAVLKRPGMNAPLVGMGRFAAKVDPCGVNGQTSPDDIQF